eukprot:TRINITY_DN3589_c0_g1_i1.p1 TRINITY_DN3589_c0_g1~~TRINITY_DN3589_c0_g1_i1.p1  ORF type:complete len:200 (-),score=58.15 TRINITY_DN3589_c0_g1_i1:352-951(-)
MKVFSVMMFIWKPEKALILSQYFELSSFGWLQKGSVQEFLVFVSREVVKRTKIPDRQTISEQGHLCHVQTRPDGLSCAVVTDQEYPPRVAYSLILAAFEEFLKVNPDQWKAVANQDVLINVPAIEGLLKQYQDPNEADKIMKIQKDLDETKDVLIKSIDQLLERGEKLDTLAQRSEDLSISTKQFVSKSQELNSCCLIL